MNNLKISFVSLGCPKNLIDSERMLAELLQNGAVMVDFDDASDVIIINTCGFIKDARQEAFENIQAALDAKQSGKTTRVIAAGCLAQLWGAKLIQKFPALDAVIGLTHRDNISHLLREITQKPPKSPQNNNFAVGKNALPVVKNAPFRSLPPDNVRLRLTEPCWAYLRISEGCNQGCTFCTIPTIRGPFRSKKPQDIIAEARELISDGALELNIIGQEVSGYGMDIGYSQGLAGLLYQLDKLPGLRWLRVLYCHPATVTDKLIDAIAQCERVVNYIDIPLQHINNRILKLMNRHINRQNTEKLLENMRKRIKNLTLRTTMMVGFPSETPQEFAEMLDFIAKNRFNALGAFQYCPEPATPAARMPNQVADEIKQQRFDMLMTAQQEIAFELADKYTGKELDLLVISQLNTHEVESLQLSLPIQQSTEQSRWESQQITAHNKRLNWYIARHFGQAPEIDSVTYLASPVSTILTGFPESVIVKARIVARKDYDLIACYRGL